MSDMNGNQVEVYCTVNNCHWWGDGNVCAASTILITHDSIGANYPESVDSPNLEQILNENGETPAESSMATCCKTFTPRE